MASHLTPVLRIYPEHRLGILRFRGVINGDLLLAGGTALVQSPDWEPGFDEVWDLTEVSEFSVAPAELKQAAEFERLHAERLGDGRAITVSPRLYVRMIHKLFEVLTPQVGRRHVTYASREDAAEALGVDPALFTP